MRGIEISLLLSAAGDSDATTKTVNDNPTIAIMSLSDGFEALEREVISSRAQASDTNDNTENLLVAWYLEQTLICDWASPMEGGDSYCDITIGSCFGGDAHGDGDGGGAGGYSGGAAGSGGGNPDGPGGGGGSYNDGVNQTNTSGANSGPGYAIIDVP